MDVSGKIVYTMNRRISRVFPFLAVLFIVSCSKSEPASTAPVDDDLAGPVPGLPAATEKMAAIQLQKSLLQVLCMQVKM